MNYVICVGHPLPGETAHGFLMGAWWLYAFDSLAEAERRAGSYVLDTDLKCTVVYSKPQDEDSTQIVSQWDGTTLAVDTWKALRKRVSDNHPKSPLTIPVRLNRAWCDWAHGVLASECGVDVESIALSGDLDALAAAVIPHLELLA